MNFHAQWRFKILTLVSSSAGLLKYVSTKPVLNSSATVQTNKDLIAPELSKNRIQNLENITSIVIAYNYVSWAKISIPTLTLLDWHNYALPDFQKSANETVILQVAHEVVSKLPSSELYVMESQPGKWIRNVNEYSLKCMLIALLSLKGVCNSENLVFQQPKILNRLHNLVIGGERISAKEVVKQKVKFHSKYENKHQDCSDSDSDCYSLINIIPQQLQSFAHYSEAEQEASSLALLVALTFLDTSIFQSTKILDKKK